MLSASEERRQNRCIGGSNFAGFLRQFTLARTIDQIDRYLNNNFDRPAFEGNDYTKIGHECERLIIEEYTWQRNVKESNHQLFIGDYRTTGRTDTKGIRLVATPDMLIGDDEVVELKTKCLPVLNPVTSQHVLQLIYYMAVTGRHKGHLLYYYPDQARKEIRLIKHHIVRLSEKELCFIRGGIERLMNVYERTLEGGLLEEQTTHLALILYDFKRYQRVAFDDPFPLPVLNVWSSCLDDLMTKHPNPSH